MRADKYFELSQSWSKRQKTVFSSVLPRTTGFTNCFDINRVILSVFLLNVIQLSFT